MDRINGIALCALLLSLFPAVAGAQAPAAKPAPPAIQLVAVTAAKVLVDEGAPVSGSMTVKNNGKAAATVSVRAWLEAELDTTGKAQERTITIEAGKTAVAGFTWPHPLGKFGHALVAEVRQNGAVVARGEDYFNACNNFWNVALIHAVGYLWQQFNNDMMPKKDFAWSAELVNGLRKDYYNSFEHFFWAPDDFLGMTPDKNAVWWSGQARYRESTVGLSHFIADCHAQGIKAVTYAKLTGGGTYGAEVARRHPEWLWQNGGTLAVDRGAESLALWDTLAIKGLPQSWVAVNYNMNDPAVVDIGIKSLSDSATLFGWDGARWDGTFDVQSEVYNLDGSLRERLSADQVDARSADNMRRTKTYVSKVHPRYVYGYNWTQGNWKQSMATNPRESIELCRNGGMIMNEYIHEAEGVQHPLHRWEDFAASVVNDVEAIKQLGGYYGPILSSPNTADGKYTNIFAYAAGAHPYYQHLWGGFMTRYSAFCWDNALTRIHEPENIITAPGSLWWRNWVFERPLSRDHKQLIVHLINPPAKPTVGEGKKSEDVPPPQRNIELKLFTVLLDGWTPVRATCLSPEPLMKAAVPLRPVEGAYAMTVPEVALWNILVIDLKK